MTDMNELQDEYVRMVAAVKAQELERDIEEDCFAGQDVHNLYMKIPAYNSRNFPYVVSRRIGYKGFLRDAAQLNGGVLSRMTRGVVEKAWKELVQTKYEEWETVHSETTKHSALKNGLTQIDISLYFDFCEPREEVQPQLEAIALLFAPLPSKAQPPQYLKHPPTDWRIVELPQVQFATTPLDEVEKRRRLPPKSRKRLRAENDDGTEDEGYNTGSTAKPIRPLAKYRGQAKKKAKPIIVDSESD